jgi:large subunit ribosomal protein L9
MDKMQVILTEDVANLGKSGELVAVKPGFGRNYLLPQGLGVHATANNVSRIAHEKKMIEARTARTKKEAEDSASKLSSVAITIERQAAEEGGKLFGSVTSKDIAEALAAKGHKIDKKVIHLAEPIRAAGDYTIEVKLARGVAANIKLTVISKA